MAIIILEEPFRMVSAYAPMVYKFFDPDGTPGAIYELLIRVDGGVGAILLVGTQTQSVYRNSQYAQFDISEIIQNFITFDYLSNSSTISLIEQDGSSILLTCKLNYYEPDSNGIPIFVATTTSSDVVACNTIADDVTDTDLDKYISSTVEFLTRQKTQILRSGEHVQLHHLLLWFGALGRLFVLKKYPISGGTSETDISPETFNRRSFAFYGEENPFGIQPSPTLLGATEIRTTDSDGKARIGVEIGATAGSSFEIVNTDIGDKVNFEVFATKAGNVELSFEGAAVLETFTCVIGYNEFLSLDIPVGTTSLKFLNQTTEKAIVTWAETLEANFDSSLRKRRGILYLNEYDATLEKIEIWMVDDFSARNVVSEVITFNMDSHCEGTRIAWLSRHGSMEHYTFTGHNVTNRDISKNKILSEVIVPVGEDRGFKTPHSQSIDSTTIFSDFENPDTLKWMAEMAESPEVFLVNAFDDRVPIDITISSFPIGGTELRQASITYRPTYFNLTQNG